MFKEFKMKIVKNTLSVMLFMATLLYATETTVSSIVTDDKTNTELTNTVDASEIMDLSASTTNGFAVCNFKIKSLPDVASGVLYMADGITAVQLNQNLTEEEAAGLMFDPKEGFVGNASFTYTGMDVNGTEGTVATVTLPVIGIENNDDNNEVNGTENLDIGTVGVSTDDKANPEMLNTLPAVDILNLSGKDGNGEAVSIFLIKTLPVEESGVLYMEDKTTAVTVDQILSEDEADALTFDPKETYVGDASFIYQAVDVNGNFGNRATVTLSIVDELGSEANGTVPTGDGNNTADCLCEDYNESIPTLSTFGMFVMILSTSLLALLVTRRELN